MVGNLTSIKTRQVQIFQSSPFFNIRSRPYAAPTPLRLLVAT